MKTVEILKFNDPWDVLIREVSQDGSFSEEAEEFAQLEQQMNEFYNKSTAPILKNLEKGQVNS